MGALKAIRLTLWALVGVLIVGVTAVALGVLPGSQNTVTETAKIGGPFELTAMDGTRMSTADFGDRGRVIFFGFTYCPDVCPTTMFEISNWLEALGPDAEKLQPIFISVDPERDTPQALSDYLSAFNGEILGMTGTPEEIAAVAKDYRIYYQRVPLDEGDYTMDHTASVLLFHNDGSFMGTIAYGEDADSAVKKLRRLARASS
ncbi:MAG: SCO family protein [Hyphomicrobiales bacterium]|nr:SCO family protein [Hyphomicrobiales bacterium]